ncbi:MAG: glycosyltransferase family 2 protein [Chloroflexi bacterium]|nr:glycosyltransferase family 2 protein [Chloroflexota bacterium]
MIALDTVSPRATETHSAATVSIVIPAFNEEQGLPHVLDALRVWSEHGAEIIVVDDGSTDHTAEVAARQGVRVIRHHHNKGYGASLKAGIRAAEREIVVTFDADGQFDVNDIARLVNALHHSDMVVGVRPQGAGSPTLRKPGKWLLGKTANYLTQTKIPDLNCGFRALRAETARRFLNLLPNGFSFTTTLTLAMFKDGYNVDYVPIMVHPRTTGKSSVRAADGLNTLLLIIRIIALFDPLKVFLPASGILFLTGIVYWIIDSITLGRPNIPSGAVILFVSAIMIFMFGVLADQVSAIRRGQHE